MSTSIPYANLEPSNSNEIVGQHMLGFTNNSWLNAYQTHGAVFKIKLADTEHNVICGHEADLDAWRQPDAWNYTDTDNGTFFRNEMGDDHVTQLSGEAHRRSRKLILPAFGIKALQRNFDSILSSMSEAFTTRNGEGDLFQITNFSYAKALANSQLKSGLDDNGLQRLSDFEDWFISGLRVPPEQQAIFHNSPEYRAIKRDAFELFERIIHLRKAGERPNDSLDMLMDRPARDNLEPLHESELVKAVYLLSVAGIGNIANILVAAIWLLDRHPQWKTKLQQELDRSPLSEMRNGMASFPILKAVMSEVERFYLPAPVIQKITTRDVTVVGTQIPNKASVLHVHGLAHYDPALYDDPFSFNPGRWLEHSLEKPHAFGGGKHLCLGMGVARLLAPLSVGILTKSFNITPHSPPISTTLAPHIESSPTTTSFPVTIEKNDSSPLLTGV